MDNKKLLIKQINNFYFIDEGEIKIIDEIYPLAVSRLENNIKYLKNKYFTTPFNPLHNASWTMFLYFMANKIYKAKQNLDLADKIYNLIKIISSMELFYNVELPEIFFFGHPIGSVIGKATFSNYFSFDQGCVVGQNKGLYPIFGEKVVMYSNSKVLGNSKIGKNVLISANTYIKDCDIPDNSIVFGQSPNLVIKTYDEQYINKYLEEVFIFG